MFTIPLLAVAATVLGACQKEDPTHGGRVEGEIKFSRITYALAGGLETDEEDENEDASAEVEVEVVGDDEITAEDDALGEEERQVSAEELVKRSGLSKVEVAAEAKELAWAELSDEQYFQFRGWYNLGSNGAFSEEGKPLPAFRLRLTFPAARYTIQVCEVKGTPEMIALIFVLPESGNESVVYRRDPGNVTLEMLRGLAPTG